MNLSERFAQNQGNAIEVDGRLVQPIYRRRVAPGERIRITVVRSRPQPVQGVRVKLQAGKVQVEDGAEPLADVVLWADTAPSTVIVECISKTHAEMRIWNCWRDRNEVMQAWIGNAAMEIREEGSTARIQCNSANEITFEDLVFEVETVAGRPYDRSMGL